MKKWFLILAFVLLIIMIPAGASAATDIDGRNIYVYGFDTSVEYTGSPVIQDIDIRDSGSYKYLKEGVDYEVSYIANTNVGRAVMTVTAIGDNYTGSFTREFYIEQADIYYATVTASDETYDGTVKTPSLTVTYKGKNLIQGVDYTVGAYSSSYKNIDAGTGRVQLTGIGNFDGTKSVSFTINKLNLANCTVTAPDQAYTGSKLTPVVNVYYGGRQIPLGMYSITYSNNTEVGTASVSVAPYSSGRYNLTGTGTGTFRIKYGIDKCSISVDEATYTGSALTPAVTVKKGSTVLKPYTDYTVSYSENIKAGKGTATITGTGYYTGSVKKTFVINPKDISLAAANLVLPEEKYVFNGEVFTPDAEVTDGITKLVKDTDYRIVYKSNKNPGYGKAIVEGMGNYSGSTELKFEIYPAKAEIASFSNTSNNGITLKWDKGPSTVKYEIYRSGNLIGTTKKGATSYKDTKGKTNGKEYSYYIVGVASASETLKGEPSEIKSTYYFKAPVPTAKVSGNKKLTVSWKKNSKVDGYQVQWSTSSKFKTKKTSTIKDAATLKKTISKLTAGKKYYFRVRAYKTIEVEVPVEPAADQTTAVQTPETAVTPVAPIVPTVPTVPTVTDPAAEATADGTPAEQQPQTEIKKIKYYSSWSKTVSKTAITATAQSSAS